MPVVAGIGISGHATARVSIEIINGATLPSTSIVVRVTPQMAGIFTIPGITPKSPPLVLQVSAAARSRQLLRAPECRPASCAAHSYGRNDAANGIHLTADGSAFVRLSVPKREVYVGESVPVEIEVGMRSGFVSSLNGLPKLAGSDNFTLNNLSRQPERKRTDHRRQTLRTLLTWHSVPGGRSSRAFSRSRPKSPLTVRIRTRPAARIDARRSAWRSVLQNFFGATASKGHQRDEPAGRIDGTALPAEGRPRGLSAARSVRSRSRATFRPAAAAAGEPLTLRMHVTGSGNFDRVDSAMLEHVDQWKTYPPKSSFNPSDAARLQGREDLRAAADRIEARHRKHFPALTFSYFDPTHAPLRNGSQFPAQRDDSPSLADSTLTASQIAAGSCRDTRESVRRADFGPITSRQEASRVPWYPFILQPRFLAIPSLLTAGIRRRMAAAAPSRGEPKS